MRGRILLAITVLALAAIGCKRQPVVNSASTTPQPVANNIPATANARQIVAPGYLFNDGSWELGFVRASGTWTNPNWSKPHTVEIQCWRELGCFEASATVTVNLLISGLEKFRIERWDNHEIVTKPHDDPFGCE